MKSLKQKMVAFLIAAMMVVTNTIVPVYASGLNKKEIENNEYKMLNGDPNRDLAPDGSIYHYAYDIELKNDDEYIYQDDFGWYRIEELDEAIGESYYNDKIYYPSGWYKIYNPSKLNPDSKRKYSYNRFNSDIKDLISEKELNFEDEIVFDGKYYDLYFDLKNIKNKQRETSLFELINLNTGERKIFKNQDEDFVASRYNGFITDSNGNNTINEDSKEYDDAFKDSELKQSLLEKIDNNEPIDLDKIKNEKLDKISFKYDKSFKTEYILKEVRTFQNRHRELFERKIVFDNTPYIFNKLGYLPYYIEGPGFNESVDKDHDKLLFVHFMKKNNKVTSGSYLMRTVPLTSFKEICNWTECMSLIEEPGNGGRDLLFDSIRFSPAGIGLVIIGFKDRLNFPNFALNKSTSNNKKIKTAWKITNNRTKEWHIIVTDKDGNFIPNKKIPETKEEKALINPFDKLINEDVIDLKDIDNKSFIDFYDFKEEDTFLLEELRSISNEGYDLKKYILNEKRELKKINSEEIENNDTVDINDTKTLKSISENINAIALNNDIYENLNTLEKLLFSNYDEYVGNGNFFKNMMTDSNLDFSFGNYDLDKDEFSKDVIRDFRPSDDQGNNELLNIPKHLKFNYFVTNLGEEDKTYKKASDYLSNKDKRVKKYYYQTIFYDVTGLTKEEESQFNKALDKIVDKNGLNKMVLKIPYTKKTDQNGYSILQKKQNLIDDRLNNLNKDNINEVAPYCSFDFIINDYHLIHFLKNYSKAKTTDQLEEKQKTLLKDFKKIPKEERDILIETIIIFLKNKIQPRYTSFLERFLDETMIPIINESFDKFSENTRNNFLSFKEARKYYEAITFFDYREKSRREVLRNNAFYKFRDELTSEDKQVLKSGFYTYMSNDENFDKYVIKYFFNYFELNIDEENEGTLQKFRKILNNYYGEDFITIEDDKIIFEDSKIRDRLKIDHYLKLLFQDYLKNATDEELGLLPIPIVRYLIVNTKTFEGKYTPEFLKILKNREIKDKEFSFDIYNSDNKLIETVNNDKDGNIKFSPIKLNKKDIGKTLEFTVKENTKDKKDYIEYDKTVYKLKIEVKEEKLENGDKKVVGTPSLYYENGDKTELAVFTNTYNSEGEYTPTATKKLEGKKLEDEKFKFTIEGVNTPYKETVENNKDGKIPFSTIKFTQNDLDKEYLEYDIYEEKDTQFPNITNDSNKYKLKLYLKDNGEGKIDVKAETEKDGITFINKYKKPVEEKGSIKIIKSVEGKKDVKESFDIKIKLGNEERTEKITTENPIEIKDIKLGTKYNIEEINIPENYELVSIDKAKGEITKDNKDIVVKIVNKYNKPVEKLGSIKVKKLVKGNDSSKEDFHFVLTVNGKEEKFTLKNNEEKVFNNIPLNSKYELREIDIPENYKLENIFNAKGTVKDEQQINIEVTNLYLKKDNVILNKKKQSKNNTKTGVDGMKIVVVILLVALIAYLIMNRKKKI